MPGICVLSFPYLDDDTAYDSEQQTRVIDMVLAVIIRRWFIKDRFSIREIAHRLDISRNTARRYTPRLFILQRTGDWRAGKVITAVEKLKHMMP